ncbi:pilus assembly protein [Dactylosporangium sp. NBC_01737]|uniref:TadE/TadG family type IV pilus assembly protein n=1 Tax=Dactylosporangium sp. NBC_01737 TaxID=2975959 RepID=UPI002E0DBDB3|nr:pilus assembly protein [Dactylosporangium sp. NBC_01737]
MTAQPTTVRRADDRGSASIEAAILAPVLLVLVGLAIAGGRIQVAGGAIESAAHDAARAASIARTEGQARADAYSAASATLDQQGLHCSQLTVVVDTSGFAIPVGQPAAVAASITCVVDLSDIVVNGIPGSKTINATFVSVLDTFRTRT